MVGLKTFSILLVSLILLSGCLPQVKETQCSDNEAFNSTLRTCVPVVGGPSSFLSIDTFYPTATQTRYKTDTTDVELSVTISNPYAQTYTVDWKRIFYNTEQTLEATKSGNSSTYKFKPSTQSLNLGSHIFTVKLKDSTGAIVDTHTFEVIVTDSPKPIIDTTTISPPSYDATYTPLISTVEYKFTILNNNATLNGAGYRTEWKLYKSGVVVNFENDTFNNVDPSGKNNPSFNVNPSSLGVGYYILSARVATSSGEVVAEKQWAITVKHPDLSKIIGRNIYNSSSSPTFTTTTIAYNGIDYNSQTTYNFIPSTVTTPAAAGSQGDYCVSFASSTGTYTTDSDYIMVNFYLDGSTLVYSGFTTALSSVVCLSDATVAELNNVIFTNTNPTSTQTHTLVARVYDEATGTEYSSTDMNSGLGTYPITWNFSVKPQNEKPTVTFGTSTPTCTSSTSTAKSGCSVTSDTNFTVNILLSSDDFYKISANENKFNYSIRLYQNGTKIEECTKTDAGSDSLKDTDGFNGYSCVLNIPSYNATGPINTTSYSYEIQAEISDTDSPLSSSGTTSQTLSWYFPLGSVTEKNTVPAISNWSVSGAAIEGGSITFSADISDAERDNFSYTIKYCTNSTCTTNTTLKSGTITRTDNTNSYALSVSHSLSEDFLLNLTNLNCDDKKRNETCNVEFLLTITDIPHLTAPLSATSGKNSSTITNINPTPVLTVGSISPSPVSFNLLSPSVFVGFPLTISQTPSSSITDSSSVSSEKTFRYQWFSKINNGVMNWTKIDGATSYNLNWTPSLIEGSSFGLSLMLCIEDQPESAVSVVNTTDSTCSSASPWTLTVLNNMSVVQDLSSAPSTTELALNATSSGNETAVWYETASTFNSVTSSAAYIAMFGNDKEIHVKKVLVKDRNQIDTINSTLLLSFNALPSGTTHAIKDLSITGNSSELYVAYLASRTGSPQSFYPQVRRIDLSSTTEKSAPNNDGGKFGFDYDGLGFTNNCTPSSECTSTQASSVSAVSFSPTAGIIGSIILATPNGYFTLDFGTYDGIDTICSSCSGDMMAQNLRDIINSSTNPLLAGYSATASGATVTIYGARSGDYYDSSSGIISRVADRLGKIYIAGSSWYLPFIDSSLGGSYNDKISFYYGSTGGDLSTNTPQIADALNNTDLSSQASASYFDNYFDGTNLWISLIKKSGGEGEVYKLNSSLTLQDSFEIFPDEALIDIKVAASSSYVYVGATKSVGEKKSLGIYDVNGNKEAEFLISNSYNVESGSETSDFFNSDDLSDYKIIPYNSEARIFGISRGTTPSNYKLYLARLREVSSTWTLSCGDCAPISEINKNVSSFVKLGVSSIRNKTTPSTTVNRLSSDGSVTSQGIRDVVFVSFGRITDAGTNSCDPALGVFNVEGESISATSLYNGTDGGLFRPPLVKN